MAKCPICGKNKSNKKELLEHIENSHKDEIPQSMTTAQYVYSLNHDGRSYGLCRICGQETPWNDKTGKPRQICGSKTCKEKISKEFEKNLKTKLNMTREDLMNDPDHQEQMLANRKISGTYKWSDNKHSFTYTGSYEKFALEWLDKVMDLDPETLRTPGPKIQYMFEGKPHYWITDMYLTEYNLVIEIKDGNGTGEKNTHPGFAHNRDLEKAKDEYMKSQKTFNYLKLTNKNMMQLVKILSEIRLNNIFGKDKGIKKDEPFININETYSLNEEACFYSELPSGSQILNQIAQTVNGEASYCSMLTWPIGTHTKTPLLGHIDSGEPIPTQVFKDLGYSDIVNTSRSSKVLSYTCSKIIGDYKITISYNPFNKENNIRITVINISDINDINSMNETVSLNEVARVNDKGDEVPDKCDKCNSDIKVYLHGEPIFRCTNDKCKKYFGTVPCNLKESTMANIQYMGTAEEISQHCNGKLITTEDGDRIIESEHITDFLGESYIEYDTNILSDAVLTEAIIAEKISGQIKDLYLNIVSYFKDITRKWQGIQHVQVSKNEKSTIQKIIDLSKKLINHITEILKTGEEIAYEVVYENFLEEIKLFKKSRKEKDKSEDLSISELQQHTRYMEKNFNESSKIKSDNKFVKKFKNALYIVLSRTLYVINLVLYNATGKGHGGNTMTDKKAGIASKRYGGSQVKLNINKLEGNSSKEVLEQLRKSTSYSSYKKIFDDVARKYKRENVSALKFLDLEKHDKLVFISYNKLKPMTLKKGTKLYHISSCNTIKALNPVYKCRDNITFFSTPRIYFTDKLMDPKKVLPNVKIAAVYEYECPKDMIAYRDNEYGSWYHHCIYVESETPLKVKNITKEIMGDKDDAKEQNESVELLIETVAENDLVEAEKAINKAYNDFKKMNDLDKKKNLSKIMLITQKAISVASHASGIGFIMDGKNELKDTDKFMKDLKQEMPMNHETYNKINSSLKIQSILKIAGGVLLLAINVVIVGKVSSKVLGGIFSAMINNVSKISDQTSNNSGMCNKLLTLLSKISSINSMNENANEYDIIDTDNFYNISNEDINSLCEGNYSYNEDQTSIQKPIAESMMSVSNLSPILRNGSFEELNPNESNKDLENQLSRLKKILNESMNSLDEILCDKDDIMIDDIDLSQNHLMNRTKTNIINKVAIRKIITNHYGDLHVTSDLHIFGVWDKKNNNNNATNIQQVNRIIDDINSKVKENDTLLILGDLGYKLDDCLYQHTKYFLDAIKCKHIWLVLGNHDLLTTDQYKELGCEIVADRIDYNNWAFTHYPVITPMFNCHGHLHDEDISDYDNENYKKLDKSKLKNCFYYTNGITNMSKTMKDNNLYLNEVSMKDASFMFGDGEYSAVTDNRFTEFQIGVPDEQNEDIDPYTAVFSPNNSKPVQDYLDASNNFETNEEVRVDMELDPAISSPNDVSSIAQSIYNSNFQ